jgi:hypothetical protein
MIDNTANMADSVSSGLQAKQGASEAVKGGGVFAVKCYDSEGNLKWEHEEHNLVVNVGLQDMNTQYFKGATYSATWYIGLWGAAASNNPAAGDTMASHAGWTEFVNYSQANRPTVTFGTATTANPSVISNSASPATFTISGAGGTVGGAFLTTNNTKSGTTGTLFSGSDFTSPGDRATVAGDTLTVTYQFSLTAT